MKVEKREEIDLFCGGSYSRKFMENGEIRTRLILPDGTRMSSTEMSDYAAYSGNLPWQDAHLHHGLTEQYTLIEGWVYFIYEGEKLTSCYHNQPGQTIQFAPGVPHVVLLGPSAKIITVLFGTPVPNSDLKNNDWWPASGAFAVRAVLEQARVEEDLARD